MHWQIKKIINVAQELRRTGRTGASTSECIAAAFALDQMAYLPPDYEIIEAWDRLDEAQKQAVRVVRRDYKHLLEVG